MGISYQTVKNHTSDLYYRLNVTTKLGAIIRALQMGILQLEDLSVPEWHEPLRWS